MKPKDRDFVETIEGHLFCVVGYLHPQCGYTAYLKYVPAPVGKWGRGESRYTRTLPFYHVSQVENTYRYLRENYPKYLLDCPVRGFTVSYVPKSSVRRYYRPRRVLREIMARGASDPLEEKLLELVGLLTDESGVTDLGVTGSILTGIHNPDFSDIDITIYGASQSRGLRDAVLRLRDEGVKVQPPGLNEVEEWCRERARKFPLTLEELRRFSEKRWNYGYYKGTYFSVHPTRVDREIAEVYGDNKYHRIGEVNCEATIADASESMFLPAVYRLEDAEMPDGLVVERLVSFEGLYSGVFEEGDRVEFKGALEIVEGKNPGHQVVVGGAGSPAGYVRWA